MSKYWVKIEGFVEGPFEDGQLRFVEGFGPETLVSPEEAGGDEVWLKAADVGGLQSAFQDISVLKRSSGRAAPARVDRELPSPPPEQIEIRFPQPQMPFDLPPEPPDIDTVPAPVFPSTPPAAARPAEPVPFDRTMRIEPEKNDFDETLKMVPPPVPTPSPVDAELLDVMEKLSAAMTEETKAEEPQARFEPPVAERPAPAVPPPAPKAAAPSFPPSARPEPARLPPKYIPPKRFDRTKALFIGAGAIMAGAFAVLLWLHPEFLSADFWKEVFRDNASDLQETAQPSEPSVPPAAVKPAEPPKVEKPKPPAPKPVARPPAPKPQARPKPPAPKKEAPEPELKTQKYLLPGVPAPSVGRVKPKPK